MPRLPRTTPTSRLTLEMANSVRKQLEHLRDQTAADSLTEVIRRALSVYDLLGKATLEGGRIIVETPDGEREVIIPEFVPRDEY